MGGCREEAGTPCALPCPPLRRGLPAVWEALGLQLARERGPGNVFPCPLSKGHTDRSLAHSTAHGSPSVPTACLPLPAQPASGTRFRSAILAPSFRSLILT